MKRLAGSLGGSSGGEAAPKRSRTGDAESVGRHDHYRKGSIVRVTLHNFMSYTDAHFEPGPLLNVILGPNGTGKSSIVCAIALGLNGPTTVLGRAKETREFIKLGTEQGFVELELARALGNGKNLVIRRTLNQDNTSDWRLNGKNKSKSKVSEVIRLLNIQVDNVCQFLAQEKVVNFAKLNAQELLIETEKAAAPPEAFERHMQLIELKKELNGQQLKFDHDKERIDDLQSQNDKLERDVLRFREREVRLAQVKIMQLKKPMVIYKTHMKKQKELEEVVEKRTKELEEYLEKAKPIQEKIRVLTTEKDAIDTARSKDSTKLKKLDELRKKACQQVNSLSGRLDSLRSDLDHAHSQKAKREGQKQKLKQTKAALEKELESLPEPDEEALAAIAKQMNDAQERLQEAKEKLREHETQTRGLKYELQAAEKEQRELGDVRRQAEQRLKSMNQDAYKARQWINSNRDELEREVYGPVLMEVNIADQYHRDCVSMQTPRYAQFGFVAQTESDRKKLLSTFERQHLRVSVMGVDSVREAASQHPNVADHLMQKYRLTWLDETFEAPPAVMKALHANASMARPVIGDRGLTTTVSECVAETGLEQLYTPESKYTSRKSRFGNQNRSTMVVPLAHSKTFIGLDESKKKELEERLKELSAKAREVADMKSELTNAQRNLDAELRDLKMQRDKLGSSRRKRHELERKVRDLDARLQSLEKHKDSSEEEAKIQKEMKVVVTKQCKLITQLVTIHQKMVLVATAGDSSHLKKGELQQEITNLRLEEQTIMDNAAQLEAQLREAESHYQAYRQSGAEKKRAAKLAMKKITPEQQKEFPKYPNDLDELDQAINESQAIADANFRSNPQVIVDYERRKKEIEEHKAVLEELGANLRENQLKITNIKDLWQPPLQALVTKIDKSFRVYFRNIGCQGQVSLVEAENFEDYSLQLKVSFRNGQDAQVLDSSTQSGGERSVTTMLYLLSIQDLTPSPFRLVDEINQGMDPTNERMIFDEVAKTACEPGQPQFFMVTPKLLPGLNFTKDMTVFFIMNGPWNITQDRWDQVSF